METINFTAIDFETATYDRMPCQLGLVVVHDGQIVEENQWLYYARS
jgi:DNA polymerase III epsilon subunit-like protein